MELSFPYSFSFPFSFSYFLFPKVVAEESLTVRYGAFLIGLCPGKVNLERFAISDQRVQVKVFIYLKRPCISRM